MTIPKFFEKPTGFRDVPPPLAVKKRLLEERIQAKLVQYGYAEVITPTLEFFETIGQASVMNYNKMFKCMDCNGNPLVLRPDQTSPIARIASSLLAQERLPLRLFSHSSVFRAQEQEAGRNAEIFQTGVECIGLQSPEVDAEVIALAIESVRAAGVLEIRMAIGHVGLLDAYLQERISDVGVVDQLKQSLMERNVVGLYEELNQISGLDLGAKQEILRLVQPGSSDVDFGFLTSTSSSDAVIGAMNYLTSLFASLADYGYQLNREIVLDFSLIGSFRYYTGVYFEAYTTQNGFPLVSGGRYDDLFKQFGCDYPAIGFALKMDGLLETSVLEPEPERTVQIFYVPSQAKKAIQEARKLRADGLQVVLYRVNQDSDWPHSFEENPFISVILLGREET